MRTFAIRRLLTTAAMLFLVTLTAFMLAHLTGDPVRLMVPEDATERQIAELRHGLGLDDPSGPVCRVRDARPARGSRSVDPLSETDRLLDSRAVAGDGSAELGSDGDRARGRDSRRHHLGRSPRLAPRCRHVHSHDRRAGVATLLDRHHADGCSPSTWDGCPRPARADSATSSCRPSRSRSFPWRGSPASCARVCSTCCRRTTFAPLGRGSGRAARRAPPRSPQRVHPAAHRRRADLRKHTRGDGHHGERVCLAGHREAALEAVYNRDFPLVQAIVLVAASMFIFINLFVDLAYGWLDPRIRLR